MRLTPFIAALAVGATLASIPLGARAADEKASKRLLARGDYIVNNVALCSDCHTPRDPKGMLIESKALQGNSIDMTPTHPMPWANNAPRLAGLPDGFTVEQLAKFLHTGVRPDGSSPRPPMPPYRLTMADAKAVATYIASLPKQ